MSTLMQASNQWATRPADQRFTSLLELRDHVRHSRDHSKAMTLSSRRLQLAPVEGTRNGLVVVGPNGNPAELTHFSFGQIAQRAGAPAGYLRNVPSALAADCINYGLQVSRDVEDIGVLLYKNGGPAEMRAVTGPAYGRVWNSTIANALFIGQMRFTKTQATAIKAAHLADEQRPIETLWDVATGATAYARGISFQDERVAIEREAGKIIDLAK